MDRGAWWATVHGAAKSWTRLSNFTFTFRASQVVLVVKYPPANAGDVRDASSIPGRRSGQPTPVFLSGESRGQKSLAGSSP